MQKNSIGKKIIKSEKEERCKKKNKRKIERKSKNVKKRRVTKGKRQVFLLCNIYYNGIYYTIFIKICNKHVVLSICNLKKKIESYRRKKIENYQN